jgi:hypothetical protein
VLEKLCSILREDTALLIQYFADDKIEKNEIDGACNADGGGRGVYMVFVGNLRERDHWGNPYLVGRIILRWIFRKWNVGVWTGLSWLRLETGGRHL